MQRVNEYRFYDLGTKLAKLRSINQDTLVQGCVWDCWFARNALEELLEDPVELQVCRPVVEKLIDTITSFVPVDVNEAANVSNKTKVLFNAHRLGSTLKELDAVLEAECQAIDTYAVSQKGAYSTSDLIERAEIMLPAAVRESVPAAAIVDVQMAGRCLVFDLPTAAGFHMLRAVESVMVALCNHVGKDDKNVGSAKGRNWGSYIKKLEEAGVDQKITSMLNNIRGQYRNPLAHPEDVLTDDEALVLLALSTAAVEQMVRVIDNKRE